MANTNVTMKTEVIKLPDFYGEPGKDGITALKFMARINECQVAKEWNDITTFSYFWLALRGQADKWLSSIVHHLQLTAAQKTWTRIRPFYKSEFAAFSDDKLIIDGLAKLSHRPNENPRMFFSHLEELIFVLKENYASYWVKPECPTQQAQGGYSEDALTKAINDNVDNFANFMFTQMFKAAAPENVRWLLSHKDLTRLTVGDAYKIFFTDHRLEMEKRPLKFMLLEKNQKSPTPNNQMLQLSDPNKDNRHGLHNKTSTNRGNRSRGQGYRSNFNNRQNLNQQNSNQPKFNAARNGKFCVYCKILNHTQQECRKCIQDNKPCVTNKGKLYWPRGNSTNDTSNAVQNNSNPNNGVS